MTRPFRLRYGARHLAIACVTGATIAAVPAGAAAATPAGDAQASNLQTQIDRMLRVNPGGKQVAPNRITWQRGSLTFTIANTRMARTAGRPYCPKRTVCLYPDYNYRGRQYRFTCTAPSGTYGSWQLGRYFAADTRQGVSSFQRTLPSASLLSGYQQYWLGTTGNIPGWFNDDARTLVVRC